MGSLPKLKVVDMVRDLVEQEKAWVERCKAARDSLDEVGRKDFEEVFQIMTQVPLTDEELDFYIMLESWDTLEENKEFLALREKWAVYLNEGDLPEDMRKDDV